MNDKTIDLLRDFGAEIKEALAQLAQGLGTATEYVFTLLVRQQYVEGSMMIAWCLFWIVLGIVVYSCYIKLLFRPMIKQKILKDSDEGSFFVWMGFVILSGLFLLDLSTSFYHMIFVGFNKVINPEYHALKQVLDLVRQATGK